MRELILKRTMQDGRRTLGVLYVMEGDDILFSCHTIERPWIENQRRVSCVPEGVYPLKYEWSPRFNTNLLELYRVPNRSEIKIHVANWARQLEGCIGVGKEAKTIDGEVGVSGSKTALDKLHKYGRDAIRITIYNP